MKSLIAVAAVASSLAAFSVPANAFPLVTGGISIHTNDVTDVGWRCGFFKHWSEDLHRCVFNDRDHRDFDRRDFEHRDRR